MKNAIYDASVLNIGRDGFFLKANDSLMDSFERLLWMVDLRGKRGIGDEVGVWGRALLEPQGCRIRNFAVS